MPNFEPGSEEIKFEIKFWLGWLDKADRKWMQVEFLTAQDIYILLGCWGLNVHEDS